MGRLPSLDLFSVNNSVCRSWE